MSATKSIADMTSEEYEPILHARIEWLIEQSRKDKKDRLRLVIALVKAAGGEIRMNDMALFEVGQDDELLTFRDPNKSETVYCVRAKPTPPASRTSAPGDGK